MTINQLTETTRQLVSRYIIHDHEKGRTSSYYKGKHGIEMLGKHSALEKAIKALVEKLPDEKSSSNEDPRKSKNSRRSSSSKGTRNNQARRVGLRRRVLFCAVLPDIAVWSAACAPRQVGGN